MPLLPGARAFSGVRQQPGEIGPGIRLSRARRDGRLDQGGSGPCQPVHRHRPVPGLGGQASIGVTLRSHRRRPAHPPAAAPAPPPPAHASSDGQAVHLLAALDQRAGAVLAQASVDGKTNEITAFAPLLEPLDLAGCVITADAMHTQRGHAEFVVAEKKAHYILAVKKNRPGLYAQVKNLPWRNIPAGCTQHGREEHRTLQVTAVAAGLAFPHAAQAIRLTRRTRPWAARRNGAPSLS